MNNKVLSFIVFVLLGFVCGMPQVMAQATGSSPVDMADAMRSEGKIYVVVLVIAILFTGILIYLINTDRKVSKLEKDMKGIESGKNP